MAAENKGGAAVWIWVMIGIVVGLAAGWWYGNYTPWVLMAGLFGWFTGLSLAHLDDGH